MAGTFSGHLLNTFNSSSAQNIVTSGAMSFDARAHGTPAPSMTPFSPLRAPSGLTPLPETGSTAEQIAILQAKLNKKLGPEYISQRPGPGGGPKLTYAEGWKIINLANEVFGFNGWSSSIVNITTDFIDCNDTSKRYDIGVTAIVRVSLRDGAYHEDVGYGMMENVKSKAAGLDKCKKEAITDALKRTLRNFGNLLGNCLYDKSYAQEVVKIKVPPARFDRNELYRRPEFEERIPDAQRQSTAVSHTHTVSPEPSSSTCEEPRVKVEHEGQQPDTPITYVPRHLRQDTGAFPRAQSPASCPTTPSSKVPINTNASTSGSTSGTMKTPGQRCSSPVDAPRLSGLVTPVHTPMPPPRPPPPRPPLARAVATSPLARMHSAPERSASSSDSTPANPVSSSSATKASPVDEKDDADADDDPFPLSTQDGAMFAAVDLRGGDLGRPIDYEEGLGGVSTMDASMLELTSESSAQSPGANSPSPQVRQKMSMPSAAPKSFKPVAGNFSSVNVQPSASAGSSTSKGQQMTPSPQVQNGTPSVMSSSTCIQESKDVRRESIPMGRFNIPSDAGSSTLQQQAQIQQQKFVPKPVPAINTLKRSADVMQAGSTRPAVQGLGLAQRQEQQNTHARPSNHHESNDVKRIKR